MSDQKQDFYVTKRLAELNSQLKAKDHSIKLLRQELKKRDYDIAKLEEKLFNLQSSQKQNAISAKHELV